MACSECEEKRKQIIIHIGESEIDLLNAKGEVKVKADEGYEVTIRLNEDC